MSAMARNTNSAPHLPLLRRITHVRVVSRQALLRFPVAARPSARSISPSAPLPLPPLTPPPMSSPRSNPAPRPSPHHCAIGFLGRLLLYLPAEIHQCLPCQWKHQRRRHPGRYAKPHHHGHRYAGQYHYRSFVDLPVHQPHRYLCRQRYDHCLLPRCGFDQCRVRAARVAIPRRSTRSA